MSGIGQDPKTGRFVKGNSGGGRAKGSRNKLSEGFLSDLADVWQEHGKTVLASLVTADPATLARIVAGLMPKDVNIQVNKFDGWTEQDFENYITEIDERIAELGGAVGDEGRGEGELSSGSVH